MTIEAPFVGMELPALQTGPITRKTLALYAGASGDHQPTHIDIDAAKAKGRQDVIAHGMLMMAYLSRVLLGWAPQERIRSYKARFVAITPVHAVATCKGQVTAIDGGIATVELSATLADGTTVVRAEATIDTRDVPASHEVSSPREAELASPEAESGSTAETASKRNLGNGKERRAITGELAQYASRARFSMLPSNVQHEASRAFLNWLGCALGGSREPAVRLAAETAIELGGSPRASIIGHELRTDIASAAFVNCISSSILGFDDAHLATVTHPSGPVASALFAWSEQNSVAGDDFLAALALGIEVTCRLSNLLVLPPSKFNVGFYVTGLTAPIGVALAIGNLLRLDPERMNWAISIAASQASGFRATHGTMTAHFRPGHAARAGVWAALLAQKGFTGNEFALEADKGFVDVFSRDADLNGAMDGLGEQHELLNNAYKPYPSGIVIHPTLDACLELHGQYGGKAEPLRAKLRVHPLTLTLCGIREPANTLESLNSLYHWTAAALVRGKASVEEMLPDCIADPNIARLRSQIEVVSDPNVGSEQAEVEVWLSDGRSLQAFTHHVRGSKSRPMTDEDLDRKFTSQANLLLSAPRVAKLRELCLGAASLGDVGRAISEVLNGREIRS